MSSHTANRQVLPLNDAFFNDGYWYVLSSTSLGGSQLSPAQIAEKLENPDPARLRPLLRAGVCLPLFFPGDCALDDAVVVVGDLTEQEEAEWIGRIQATLNIPCGEFLVMGGGLAEDFEVALSQFEAPDPHFVFFQKFKLEPGTYLVEVYAFLGSMTVNIAWGDLEDGFNSKALTDWWRRTRPGQDYPQWLTTYLEDDYIDSSEFGLLEYLIRLTSISEAEAAEIPIPALVEENGETFWCGAFEMRRPEPCPLGINREAYGRVTRDFS